MRRILLIFSLYWIIGSSVNAQQFDLHIRDVFYCNATQVKVPITVDQTVTMNSMQFAFQWEGSGLSFDTIVAPPLINVTTNTLADTAIVVWSIPGSQTFNAGDTLFLACYDFTGTLNTPYNVEFYTGNNFQVPQIPRAWLGINELTVTPIDGSATVSDDEPAFQNCPMDITANTDPSNCSAVVNWTIPTVIDCDDNAGMPVEQNGLAPGQSFNVGTTAVEYVVIDADGQTDTCRFNIIVSDSENPTISCTISDITVMVPQGTTSTVVTNPALVPTTGDNCPGEALTYTRLHNGSTTNGSGNVNGQTFQVGTTLVTYTVTDASGNTASCTFNVIIQQQSGGGNGIALDIGDESIYCCNDSIVVPVIMQNTATFRSFNLAIYWDGLGLSYRRFDSAPLNLSFVNLGQTADTLIVGYTGPSGGITLNAGDTLFTVTLNVLNCTVGNSYFVKFYDGDSFFIPHPPSFFDPSNALITPVTTLDGSVDIFDDLPPSITCPADHSVSVDANCEFTLLDYRPQVTATDDCDMNLTLLQEPAPGTIITGNTTVLLIAEDDAGNRDTCELMLTVEDNINPTITCPSNQTLTANASCQFVLPDYTGQATTDDNCDNNVMVTQSPAAGTTISNNTVVTLTATDDAGNTATCSFNVTATDQPPMITCPGNQTEPPNANCVIQLSDYTGLAIVSDDCSATVTVTQFPLPGTSHTSTTTVTLTATDGSGNTATCSFDVIPEDSTPPSISCPANQNEDLDASCQFTLPDYTGMASADDNCDNTVTVSQSPAAGSVISSNSVITLTAMDDNGNTATCTFMVILSDNMPPLLTCPPNQTIEFDINCQYTMLDYTGLGSVSDNCDPNPSVVQAPAPGTLLSGDVLVTFTATDISGNSSVCTFFVNPQAGPPSITCPADQEVDFNANCEYVVEDFTGLATANGVCTSIASITQVPAPGIVVTTATLITLTATDQFGSTATCNFGINPVDNMPPNVNCPADQSLSPDANCDATLPDYTGLGSAIDNCDGALSISQMPPAGTVVSGNTVVTFSATDSRGNTGTCTFNVILLDAVPPSIMCPADQTVSQGLNCQATLLDYTDQATTNDNCDNNVEVSQSPAPGSPFTGSVLVTLTATDDAGNTATCTFNVTTQDFPPTIVCPANQIGPLDENCEFIIPNYLILAAVQDDCDQNVQVVQSPAPGTVVTSNSLITLTATDDAGNTASCTFEVIIEDDTSPTLECPANQLVDYDPNCEYTLLNYIGLATFSDNCDAHFTVSQDPPAGTLVNGQTTITLTATDNSGNSSTCTFEVIPSDNTPPALSCPPDMTLNAAPGNNSVIVNNIAPSVSDNCGMDRLTYTISGATTSSGLDDASGTEFFFGTSIVVYTATDDANNTSTCEFSITVNGPVTIACPNDTMVNNEAGTCVAIVNSIPVTILTGNNQVAQISYTLSGATTGSGMGDASGTTFNVGTTTVTYTVIDVDDNQIVCPFDVIVKDTEPPTISCPADVTATTTIGFCSIRIDSSLDPSGINDNCTIDNVSYELIGATTGNGLNDANGTVFNTGTTTIVYTVSDQDGNTATCSFTVTVNDMEPPTISCPADVTVTADMPGGTAIVNGLAPTANDDCSTHTVSYTFSGATAGTGNDDASGSSFNTGVTTVTYTATDGSGHTATCSFTVTVEAGSMLVCPPDQQQNNDSGLCSAIVNNIAPSTNLPAGMIQSLTYQLSGATSGSGNDDASGTAFNVGNTLVTYSLLTTDGESANCSFNVSIQDAEAPALNCPPSLQVTVSGGNISLVVNNIAPTFSDNCGIQSVGYTITGATSGSGSDDASGTAFNLGQSTVSYTVEDVNGNTSDCQFVVTVSPTLADLIDCPADVMDQNIAGSCSAVINNISPVLNVDPAQIDNITYQLSGATTGSGTGDPSGETFNVGITTVSITATDINGNTDACSFTVTINDTEPPSISCPNGATFGTDFSKCYAIVGNLAPTLSDNCPGIQLSYQLQGATSDSGNGDASGLQFNKGTTTVTYTATDAGGNQVQCSFDIIVVDDELPFIGCPDDVVLMTNGAPSATVNNIAPRPGTISDNCGVESVVWSLQGATSGFGDDDVSGTSFNAGTTVVTYLVTDFSGNTFDCTFNVTIDPGQPMDLIDCRDDLVVDGCASTIVNDLAPILLTNPANIASIVYQLSGVMVGSGQDDASGLSFDLGTTTITYTATGTNGQTDQCSFTVTVVDNESPVFGVCPGNIQLNSVNASCGSLVNWTPPAASDNCGTVTLVGSHQPGGFFPVGNTTVTYTATDAEGNTASCSFVVTVLDVTPPAIGNCPPNNISYTYLEDCRAIVNWGPVGVADNCPGATLTSTHSPGDTFPLGTTTVVYVAVDASGNNVECSFDLNVEDLEPPVVVACPDDVTISADEDCMGIYGWEGPTAEDNCSPITIVCTPNSGSLFPLGTTIVNCVVSDESGNTALCSFAVTVEDDLVPQINCNGPIEVSVDGTIISDPADIIVRTIATSDCDEVSIVFNEPTASDNCNDQLTVIQSDNTGFSSGDAFPVGTTTLTYMTTDAAGNSVSCDLEILVRGLESINVSVVNGDACAGQTIQLMSNVPAGVQCSWSGPNGFSSTDPNPSIPNADASHAGTYTLTCQFANGCSSQGSAEVIVNNGPEFIINTIGSNECRGTLSLLVDVSQGSGVDSAVWNGPCDILTDELDVVLTGLDPSCNGTYTITAYLDGCAATSSIEINVSDLAAPELEACGEVICLNESCLLSGTFYAGDTITYHWDASSPDAGLPGDLDMSELLVTPAVSGTYTYYYWVTNEDGCASDTASVVLNVAGQPDAINDTLSTSLEISLEDIDFTANDVIFGSAGFELLIISNPQNGNVILNADGTYDYIPNTGFIGTDQFTYRICYDCNEELCDEATVFIEVTFDEDCRVPTLITPNDDGVNDELVILCLEGGRFPNNEIIIFNQWGDQVFKAKPYQNNWDGTLNGQDGKDLPDATYFYILDKGDNSEMLKGFVTIFR